MLSTNLSRPINNLIFKILKNMSSKFIRSPAVQNMARSKYWHKVIDGSIIGQL